MKAEKFEDYLDDHDIHALETELGRRDFHEFVRLAWPILHPDTQFVDGFHIQAICDHLAALKAGQIKNLLITVAPRHTKSVLVSICWPAWVWLDDPSFSFMFVSFAAALASDHSVKCRRLIESRWYQSHWGDKFVLTSDQNEKMKFENDHRGVRAAFGMGGVTGQGATAVIVDDPSDVKDWTSPTKMKATIDTYDSAVYTRVNNPNDPRRLVIMQRISDRDLAGHLLKQGGWEHLMLPTEYEPRRAKATSIGWKDQRTKPGELLCPARFSAQEVTDAKRRTPRIYQAQHQQNPSTDENAIFGRNKWRYYALSPEDMGKRMEVVIMSVDAAFKAETTSSMVAIQVWGKWGANKFLLDRRTEHLGFNDTVNAIRTMSRKWPQAKAKVVEDRANGPAIIETLKDEIPGIIPWPPKGEQMDSKVGRAWSVQPEQEAGNLYLPDPDMIPWVNEYVEIMAAFPEGEWDDDPDATSQAIQRLERMPSNAPPSGVGRVQPWIR
jgi:predicted phage terminase large subunit-like protein